VLRRQSTFSDHACRHHGGGVGVGNAQRAIFGGSEAFGSRVRVVRVVVRGCVVDAVGNASDATMPAGELQSALALRFWLNSPVRQDHTIQNPLGEGSRPSLTRT
jgi:hypothetical protein